jgi:hypothetical protein
MKPKRKVKMKDGYWRQLCGWSKCLVCTENEPTLWTGSIFVNDPWVFARPTEYQHTTKDR